MILADLLCDSPLSLMTEEDLYVPKLYIGDRSGRPETISIWN